LTSFYSCEDSTEPITAPLALNDQFEVSLWQRLTPNGAIPQLKIEALLPQDCLDTEISITQSQSNEFFINEFNVPNPCNNPGEHYPLYYADINSTQPISLDVFGNGTSAGEIKIDSDKVELSFDTQNLFLLSREELLLIDKNIYWGYFEIDDEAISDIAEARLTQTIEQAFDIEEGDYGHFSWSENMVTLSESTSSYARSFLHQSNETSWPNVSASLQSIKDQYPSLKAKFTNWDGEVVEF